MKRLYIIIASLLCANSLWAQEVAKVENPVDYVNILMGTQSKFELSNGNTYPAVARPWGMNFWTPQTAERGNGWTYSYTADKIVGFKQTHQPSPWINDYGQFSLMPFTGSVNNYSESARASWFSHKAEVATPYYYSVYLADHDVVVEVAPTQRAAYFEITFPQADSSFVVLDAFGGGSHVEIFPDENKIVGYSTQNSGGVPDNFKNYFVAYFDKPFTYTATFSDKELNEGVLEASAEHSGAVVGFSTVRGEKVGVRVVSSFISTEQAEVSLAAEIGERTFNEIKTEGRKEWNTLLSRFEIEGADIDYARTFYSTLYRTMLFPRRFYEITAEGEVMHYSPYNGEVLSGYMYTDTGFWDTFRSLFPLLNLMFPSINLEIQEGLVNAAKESGFLPEWASPGHRGCMIGNNSSSVVADAYLNGVRVDDIETLYQTALEGTQKVHPTVSSTGRLGHEYYNELGYVPYNVGIHENAARTLEYAYNDWCLYMLSKELDRPKKEQKMLRERALNYKNLFDPETKLMRGRNEDGTFQTPFNPLKWGDAFTEGNSWHYTWSVFQDVEGLIELMGGKREFVAMMDSVFSVPPHFDNSYYGFTIHEIREMQIMNMGNYAHGNQPIQHFPYLYNYAGEPWKSQYWVREIIDKLYSATPDGYCGDEDNGQTSAWYVFSSLGFYPVTPASGEFVLGTPLFKKITLHLENGESFVISAPNNSFENRYIQSAELNGELWTKNFLRFSDIAQGGEIVYDMGSEPNKERGIEPDDIPYSLSSRE
ncbi:MAG: GH92 family glycosyl hydrolase [Rikenellaceae bacterium]